MHPFSNGKPVTTAALSILRLIAQEQRHWAHEGHQPANHPTPTAHHHQGLTRTRLKLETLTKETVITTTQNMLSTISQTNVISVIRSEGKGQGEDHVQCCTILIHFYLTCKLSFTTEYLTPAVCRWQFPFTQTWAIGVNTVWLLTTTYFFLPCDIFSSLCVYKTHISAELILSRSYIRLPYMSCTASLVKVIWNMVTWIIKWKTI